MKLLAKFKNLWREFFLPPFAVLLRLGACVGDFHRFRVALAAVVHFEDVFVRAQDFEDGFHGHIALASRRAIGFAFERDGLVRVFAPAFGDEHRSLDVADPDHVEFLFGVVVSDEASAGKRFAHHLAVEFLFEKTAVQNPTGFRGGLSDLGRTAGFMPAFHLGLPISG